MVPITNQAKGYPFEVPLPKNMKVREIVLSDAVKNIDWQARKANMRRHCVARSYGSRAGALAGTPGHF